ncbi:MAG: tetratricopeptide repeat protein [Reichenbachiella sp.]|uniref:tetratricopeptide repeat protein n=1 Tax=Reichenbachiella sp. TaxID=2184521 RepID=UPI0029663F8B|nr:tetratricopeptide repeat protein [Reichenbachiella sp.]MDW3209559.1 tetratricopeptide repeat protein [Reichenbachiella sp.]
MRQILSLFIIGLLAHELPAQQQKIDSLEKAAASYLFQDSVKVDLYNLIAFEVINTNPDKGRKYATQGYELAKQIGYQNGYARGLNLVGSSLLTIGEYDTALEFYLASLKVYEQSQYQMGIFITYNNIGELYEKKFQYKEALQYHKKSLALKNKHLRGRKPIMSYVNLGQIYYRLNYLDSAINHFQIGEQMAKEENRPRAIAYAQTGIGKVLAKQKDYTSALTFLNQANEIYQQREDYLGMSGIALEKAKISIANNQFDQSKLLVEETIKFADIVNAKELKLEALALQYKTDSTLNDFEAAFLSMRKLHKLASEIFDIAKEKQLQTIQAKFEFEESQRLQDELLKEKETSQKIVRYQRTIIAGIAVILLLISIIAILFYYQVKKQARLNRLLKDKNREIKEKALELEILNNNLEQIVEERTSVIQKKDVKLKEYSFLNAHIVRGPLANILGLTKLLKGDMEENEKREMIDHLYYSADKLDDVLTDIKKKLEKGEMIN